MALGSIGIHHAMLSDVSVEVDCPPVPQEQHSYYYGTVDDPILPPIPFGFTIPMTGIKTSYGGQG